MILPRCLLACVAGLGVALPATFAQSTAFTYQGRLDAGGQPANGLFSLKFTLHSAAAGGTVVGTPLTNAPVGVTNGLFTVTLDFGLAPFDGSDRWLELGVRTNGVNTAHTVLAPRQAVTATPYSLRATTAGTAATVTAGGVAAGQLANGAVTAAKLAANAVSSATIADGTVGLADLGPDVGVWTKTGANLSYSGGSVGIGTASLKQTLHVAGDYYGKGHVWFYANEGDGNSGTVYLQARDDSGKSSIGLQLRSQNAGTIVNAIYIAPNGETTVQGAATFAGEITCVAVNLTSDRNAKEEFKPVNARDVLAKVVGLPISEWQYKAQGDSRHIGPMAQDFRAAFALGRDEKHIASVDADGVALAAIQGLNEKLEEKTREVDALKQSVAELRELVSRLAR